MATRCLFIILAALACVLHQSKRASFCALRCEWHDRFQVAAERGVFCRQAESRSLRLVWRSWEGSLGFTTTVSLLISMIQASTDDRCMLAWLSDCTWFSWYGLCTSVENRAQQSWIPGLLVAKVCVLYCIYNDDDGGWVCGLLCFVDGHGVFCFCIVITDALPC